VRLTFVMPTKPVPSGATGMGKLLVVTP
jgi:hypothetical protein